MGNKGRAKKSGLWKLEYNRTLFRSAGVKMKIIIVAVLTALLLTSETVSGVPTNPEPFNLTTALNKSYNSDYLNLKDGEEL